KEMFPLIKDNRLWMGFSPMGKDYLFGVPLSSASKMVKNKKEGSAYRVIDGVVYGRAQACWYTNLDHDKRHEDLILVRRYKGNEPNYPKYDNYNAIEVGKVAEIP